MADKELKLVEIGNRIAERRKQLGLTQEALADKGDMTTQFVSYAEAGKRAMRPENLLKISSALEVSADYLLTGEIIDKDLLILSDKLRSLSPTQGGGSFFNTAALHIPGFHSTQPDMC